MRSLFLATLLVPTFLAPAQEAAVVERPVPAKTAAADGPRAAHEAHAPSERFEVARVVDGDTLHILRDGKLEKLRLLCVDTEERLGNGFQGSASKPQTVFGEECALWAQRLFADLADEDGTTRVGLLFPGGNEQVDPFGRLLCHVILPDGTDFNLELVRRGKSPYFNKYGNSEVCHEEFAAAQRRAREAGIGIWAPGVNEPADEDAPAARRPYELLLPWWQARADAIEAFRAAHAKDARRFVACDDLDAMAAAAQERRAVTVFGEIDRLFDERNGDMTVLFRSPDRDRALRVRIPSRFRDAHAALDLAGAEREYRQNYLFVDGTLSPDREGFKIVSEDPAAWRRAGPEPKPADAGVPVEAGH